VNTLASVPRQSRAEVDFLRHELRTPVIHIVGYTELLMETAEDIGRLDLMRFLADIRKRGKSLLHAVSTVPTPLSEMSRLRELIAPKLDAILSSLDEVEDHAISLDCPPFFLDIARIRSASERLRVIVRA
jgi:signal transduction histidine kinase